MKLKIAELIRSQGYDLITALEMAHDCLTRFKASGQKKATYHIGGISFTLQAK